MHESFSKKKVRKDRVFNRGSLIREKTGPDFVVCMNSEKVVKYPEACLNCTPLVRQYDILKN